MITSDQIVHLLHSTELFDFIKILSPQFPVEKFNMSRKHLYSMTLIDYSPSLFFPTPRALRI